MNELVIESIKEALNNSDIVNIRVLNLDGRFFSYKGFFIKIDKSGILFYDVIKEKKFICIEDIREITTLQKGGAKFIPAWKLLYK
jgi:hypothetical protein